MSFVGRYRDLGREGHGIETCFQALGAGKERTVAAGAHSPAQSIAHALYLMLGYCRAMATRSLSSGVTKWLKLSRPTSSCTQWIMPVKCPLCTG